MLEFYTIDGIAYDVATAKGRLAYQRKASEKLVFRDDRKKKLDKNIAKFGSIKLNPTQKAALLEAKSDGQLAIIGMAESASTDDSGEAKYYALNALHTGTQAQVGLPLKPCARALQMVECKDENGRTKYRSTIPGLEKVSLFPYQVTGAATCLIAMIGYIPQPENAPESARKAADSLRGRAIGGKFICDQTGMGKSMLLLVIVYYARFHKTLGEHGNRIYEFTHLDVPAGVIKQWVDEILRSFPELKLIISYDDTGLDSPVYEKHFVTATAMKHYGEVDKWPERFRYIFDEQNPDTGMTVIITSHDTAHIRTLEPYEVIIKEGEHHDPPVYDAAQKEVWKTPPKTKTEHRGRLAHKVGIGAVDEAQRLKDKATLRWKAYSKTKPRFSFVLGATPMSNIGVVSQSKTGFWPDS